MSSENNYFYKLILQEELAKRVDRNAQYSIRSFAALLGLNSSNLSQILSGGRAISTKVAERILDKLELSAGDQEKFIQSILDEKQNLGLKRVSPLLRQKLKQVSTSSIPVSRRSIGLDEFRIISDWYHYAILELTRSIHFKPDLRWIAKELNISQTETNLAIKRLLSLELLEKIDGTFRKTDLKIGTKDKTKTSPFHKKRQKQILEKSIHSLETDPIESRNHSGITFCLDPVRMPEIKDKIQKFIWELSQFSIEGSPEQVYELHVGLLPLNRQTKKIKKEI